MNWESSILNRIYRTNDLKFTIVNINNIKDKQTYIKKLNEFLLLYQLNESNIRINSNGALYKLNNNKNTFYFSFNLNVHFYLYANFFDAETKHVKYASYWKFYFYNENDQMVKEEDIILGKKLSNSLKTLLLKFLYSNEYEDLLNDIPLEEYYKKFNDYFKFRNFLIGNEISLYDVVLLSILFLYKEKTNIYLDVIIPFDEFIKKENKDKIKYKHLQRWIFTIRDYCSVEYIFHFHFFNY